MLLGDFSFETFFDHSTRTFKSIHFLPSFYHTSVERRLKKGKKDTFEEQFKDGKISMPANGKVSGPYAKGVKYAMIR